MMKLQSVPAAAAVGAEHVGGGIDTYYQVDHSSRVTGSGVGLFGFGRRHHRHLARWIFGMSHPAASGLRGAACRGAEHEVILFWDEDVSGHYELWILFAIIYHQ